MPPCAPGRCPRRRGARAHPDRLVTRSQHSGAQRVCAGPLERVSEGRYRVELSPAARRELGRLPPGVAASLRGPILALGIDPRPAGVSKLVGSDFWRIRIADLRVVYAVDDAEHLVIVLRIARRSERTYRPLG